VNQCLAGCGSTHPAPAPSFSYWLREASGYLIADRVLTVL